MDRVKHRPTLFLAVLLVLGFLLLSLRLDSRIQSLKGFLYYTLDPGPKSADWVAQHVRGSTGFLASLIWLHRENDKLQKRVSESLHQRQAMNVLQEENARLRKLLGYIQESDWKVVPVRVIGRDPQEWHSSLLIDHGWESGLAKNDVVLAVEGEREGVVGRVIETSPRTAKILLLTDALSSVAGVLKRSRDDGIIEGLNQSELKMDYLSEDSDIQAGDEVWTSGMGGIFPEGLLIGRVKAVLPALEGGFKAATVEPGLHLYRLRELLVVKREKSSL